MKKKKKKEPPPKTNKKQTKKKKRKKKFLKLDDGIVMNCCRPSPQECDLIWKQGCCRCHQLS